MAKPKDLRGSAIQRLRELFPRTAGWEEVPGPASGSERGPQLVKVKIGSAEQTLALDISTLGQPRQIREAITRMGEIKREMAGVYPVAVAEYIGPQSGALLKRSGLGYLDLSGNCHLAFDNVLIEKEGKPNRRPSTRPLKSLFAPRATRVVRVLLVDPQHAWRLEELAKAADVSLGHAHNVVKRVEQLSWISRGDHQRIHLVKPGDLLDAWADSYSYRSSDIGVYLWPERITRKGIAELGRLAHAEGRRYAFTLHAGAALIAPNLRFPAIHCYVEGNPEPIIRALGLRAGEGEGNVYLMAPYDEGVFYAPMTKGGLPVVSLPQLYADLYQYERRGREQALYLRREAMGY